MPYFISMDAKAGDKVKVITKDETIEGVLMPNEETDSVVIKLDNGYNIGIDKNKVKEIKNGSNKKMSRMWKYNDAERRRQKKKTCM